MPCGCHHDASANDGANLLAEYFGGGSIEGGVAAMNAQAKGAGAGTPTLPTPTASAMRTTTPQVMTWRRSCAGR